MNDETKYYLSRSLRVIKAIFQILIICFCKAFSLFSVKRHWVLCERGTDARDNAYFFYKYMKSYHPEQKIYYIIDKNSADYGKVKEDAVKLGSFLNYWVISTTKKLISTHYGTGMPGNINFVYRLCGLNKNLYFLQHGITNAEMVSLKYPYSPMQLFACGAKPEYEYIRTTFGHPDNVVQYTGLARFDWLHDITVNYHQILIMPTWRQYIKSKEKFLHSDYYKRWQELISDSNLLRLLEQYNLTLVFYVHYEMQKYIDCFHSDSDHVIIASFSQYDVQALLKESAVLITDYSSVYFDFAYMKKPLIYYQFDEEQFFSYHYKKGYFDYRKMGFGDVCVNSCDVIACLTCFCENKMQSEAKYLDRIEKFFPLNDTENCARIYDAITRTKYY